MKTMAVKQLKSIVERIFTSLQLPYWSNLPRSLHATFVTVSDSQRLTRGVMSWFEVMRTTLRAWSRDKCTLDVGLNILDLFP